MLNLYDDATAAKAKGLRERHPGMSEDALALFVELQDMHAETMRKINELSMAQDMLQAHFMEMYRYATASTGKQPQARTSHTRSVSSKKSRAVSVDGGDDAPPAKRPGHASGIRRPDGHVA